jgi:hypothetical protein
MKGGVPFSLQTKADAASADLLLRDRADDCQKVASLRSASIRHLGDEPFAIVRL